MKEQKKKGGEKEYDGEKQEIKSHTMMTFDNNTLLYVQYQRSSIAFRILCATKLLHICQYRWRFIQSNGNADLPLSLKGKSALPIN